MIECMRLIIGEVGTREREREGLKIGRSERSRTIWAAVKGPVVPPLRGPRTCLSAQKNSK